MSELKPGNPSEFKQPVGIQATTKKSPRVFSATQSRADIHTLIDAMAQVLTKIWENVSIIFCNDTNLWCLKGTPTP